MIAAPAALPDSNTALDIDRAVLGDAAFARIKALIYAEAGIAVAESKKPLIFSRLSKRLRKLGMGSFDAYCDLVEAPSGAEELNHMISALTTNVTAFFREPHHFEDLKTRVLPRAIHSLQRGGRVRLWSAGCSNGSEPYSIALTLLSMMPDAPNRDVKILATDIDTDILADGQAGVYPAAALESVPAALRDKYFRKAASGGDDHVVDERLKKLVAFKRLNLVRPWPVKGPFDAIFCRNVVIYFDDETKQRIWPQFAHVLAPGGSLYIGHSERITGPGLGAFVNDGLTTYRRSDRSAASTPRPGA